jgi:hypothetical protein
MAEDQFQTMVVPGVFVRVQAEGLIGAPGISTGNIGIVGTATQVDPTTFETTYTLSQFSGDEGAVKRFGMYDAYDATHRKLNLTRGLEVLYRNGALTVYARAVAEGADTAAYTDAFRELLKENVQILVAPELSTSDAMSVLSPIVTSAEETGQDVIAIVGSDARTVSDIKAQVNPSSPRIVLVAPGIMAHDAATGATADVALSGTYSAAAVAGLISTLAPQTSPTNKELPGVLHLDHKYTYGSKVDLIDGGVLVLEERLGVRVVRGITTDFAADGPYKQITTRRIVDYAKAGIRDVGDAFVGRLNNARVRKALQGAIDGFLTSMLVDEALTAYQLQVTATRDDEINGRAIVNALLMPTFSIDFVAVTLTLQ